MSLHYLNLRYMQLIFVNKFYKLVLSGFFEVTQWEWYSQLFVLTFPSLHKALLAPFVPSLVPRGWKESSKQQTKMSPHGTNNAIKGVDH